MSWYSKLLRKHRLHLNDCHHNRNKLLELHKNNTLIILLNISSIKRSKYDNVWAKTKDVSTKLLKQVNIIEIDQYYHKLIRILRHTLLKKIVRHNIIKHSPNKQLRINYKKGSNNIIGLFAENQNLSEGCSTPIGMEHLPSKIIRDNNKTIKRVFGK